MSDLSKYTEDELIEELARRNNARIKEKPEKWCHDCAHWKNQTDEKKNPCQKGHTMQFCMPEYSYDEEFGFYRNVCADRKPLEKVGLNLGLVIPVKLTLVDSPDA